MSKRVWSVSLITLVLICAGYATLQLRSESLPNLRSQHSQPAVKIPSAMVVVIDSGRVFHRPECTYIRKGERVTMTAEAAIAQGYTPCARCYRDVLPQ